jgi:hypothetical protein
MNFEDICKDLKLNWKKKEKAFQVPWNAFSDALKKKAIRTISYHEGFLMWLIALKHRPKAICELGSQHGHSGQLWMDVCKRTGSQFIAVELGNDPRNKYPDCSIGTMEFLPDDSQVIKIWGDAEEELPGILKKYPVELVFHDCAHTWNHVENCLKIVKNHDDKIMQLFHDAGKNMWVPARKTQYGVICAERPVFDKYYKNDPNYYYNILEDKYGLGIVIHRELL